jgi:hypothetical protein
MLLLAIVLLSLNPALEARCAPLETPYDKGVPRASKKGGATQQ